MKTLPVFTITQVCTKLHQFMVSCFSYCEDGHTEINRRIFRGIQCTASDNCASQRHYTN